MTADSLLSIVALDLQANFMRDDWEKCWTGVKGHASAERLRMTAQTGSVRMKTSTVHGTQLQQPRLFDRLASSFVVVSKSTMVFNALVS